MTAKDIIKQVQIEASEWLEMTQDPATMLVGILANKIVQMQGYIEYLEKRLEHERTNTSLRG